MKELPSHDKPKIMNPFTLYHNGKVVTVIADAAVSPIVRLCSSKNDIFLLGKNTILYKGNYEHESKEVVIRPWKSGIIDVDLWEEQLYIVEEDGSVYTKLINSNEWTKIEFDTSNEVNERIFVRRIKCNKIGNLYLTSDNILYGSGYSGEILTKGNPKRLECFAGKRVIDFSAGEDFFITLICGEYEEEDEESSSSSSPELIRAKFKKVRNTMKRNETVELEMSDTDERSNSKDSLLTKSNESCDNKESSIRHLLQQGHNIVMSSVCSFGTSNNGVLGTGDHIKRPGLNAVLSLMGIGVCAVYSGREHSLAKTIDGRIFHWGLNSQTQIDSKSEVIDFSSPKELQLDKFTKKSVESYVVDVCCGNFSTVILNSDMIVSENGICTFQEDFILHPFVERNVPLILSSNGFTLQNHKTFEKCYEKFLTSMRSTVRNCIKNRFSVNFVNYIGNTCLQFSHQLCQEYLKILYILAICLQTVEEFYRRDINFDQLLFLKNYKEMITVFENYSKSYCDVKSINGFVDMTRIDDFIGIEEHEEFEKVFTLPFSQVSNIIQFIEQLFKQNTYVTSFHGDKLTQWQNFATRNRIDIELADHTKDFWKNNVKNLQLRQFKKKHRRVILDSENVPLKLNNGGKFSTHSFILFSDCFCQYGTQFLVFPLTTMWIKIVGTNSIKIITPEKLFVLTARTHEDKMLWFDQFENTIKMALGKSLEEKLSNVRTANYVFSDRHPKYPGVNCYGRWQLGVLHGRCYLEYPDGKIYYGEMNNGEIEGYGKMVLPSNGLYEGYFKAGKFHGYGVYEMKDNEIYEGNFKEGVFHGHGVLRTASYTYVGEFVGNAKCGYGVLDDAISGDKYMGMFVEDKRTGAGICITMNGNYFEGIFLNDELSGEGVAVFENGYYYEGELTTKGPNGKGCYYLPHAEAQAGNDNEEEKYMMGNVISGILGGTWDDVKIINGSVAINKKFSKCPKTIGQLIVDNDRKWRSLFDNWEEMVFGSSSTTQQIWSKIAIFINSQREKEKLKEQDFFRPTSYFAKNITLRSNYADFSYKFSSSLDKISLRSTSSLNSKRSTLEINTNRKSYSNETLFDREEKFNRNFMEFDETLNSFLNGHCERTSVNGSESSSIESSMSYKSNVPHLDYIPNYGINSLKENDINAIKEYLSQAFKDSYHPLSILNEKISSCFYASYGCWKVKPTLMLSSQALCEWESISMRVYKIVRRMFPALPVEYCAIEGGREVISHTNLLYPIVLSEGVYSTLFVLYANKYSERDELYRQRILMSEKRTPKELATLLCLDSSTVAVMENDSFKEAISTFKQVQEKYCPQGMLSIIEKSMHLIEKAHTNCLENTVILSADSIMPLTIYLVLRAGVPHLGAELALLEDLVGGASYEAEMSGFTGYCYTTVKAAYEHIISEKLGTC